MYVCARVRVRTHVRVCDVMWYVCARVFVCVCVCTCACSCVCVRVLVREKRDRWRGRITSVYRP